MTAMMREDLEAVDSSSPDIRVIRDEAEDAARKGDWPKAVASWSRLSSCQPLDESGILGMSHALRRLQRYDEALRLLEEGSKSIPGSKDIFHAFGWLFIDRRQFHEAITRFVAGELLYGKEPGNRLGLIVALKRSNYRDAAEALLARTLAEYPGNFSVAAEYAKIAAERRDWSEALTRWTAARQRFRDHPVAVRGCVQALRELGSFQEAERELGPLIRRLPKDEWILLEHAEVAVSAGDLGEGIKRLTAARATVPASAILRNRLGELHQLAEMTPIDNAERPADVAVKGQPAAEQEAAALFSMFEAVGDNCEFGLAQRYFGAEPLGLLRWTSILANNLVRALQNRFEDMLRPDNLKLIVKTEEYYLTDDIYGTYMHTFIRTDVDSTKLHSQMVRRIRFLTERLLSQLEGGDKIFVFKPADGKIDDKQVDAIFEAISAYGQNRLLCVREGVPGRTALRAPGLVIGELSRVSPGAFHGTIQYKEWMQICSQTASLLAASSS